MGVETGGLVPAVSKGPSDPSVPRAGAEWAVCSEPPLKAALIHLTTPLLTLSYSGSHSPRLQENLFPAEVLTGIPGRL